MIRLFAILLSFAAFPAAAHQLNVFAFVEDETVVVEAKFSSGRTPNSGEVRVFDAVGDQIDTLELGGDGTLRFPLDPAHVEGGLLIEVEASDGHENWWILTPDDIAHGMEGEGS